MSDKDGWYQNHINALLRRYAGLHNFPSIKFERIPMSEKSTQLQVRDLKLGDEVEYYWSAREGWSKFVVVKKTAEYVPGEEPRITLELSSKKYGSAYSITQTYVNNGRLRLPLSLDENLAKLRADIDALMPKAREMVAALEALSKAAR